MCIYTFIIYIISDIDYFFVYYMHNSISYNLYIICIIVYIIYYYMYVSIYTYFNKKL